MTLKQKRAAVVAAIVALAATIAFLLSSTVSLLEDVWDLETDASVPTIDASPVVDAPLPDAPIPDAPLSDASQVDASTVDAGPPVSDPILTLGPSRYFSSDQGVLLESINVVSSWGDLTDTHDLIAGDFQKPVLLFDTDNGDDGSPSIVWGPEDFMRFNKQDGQQACLPASTETTVYAFGYFPQHSGVDTGRDSNKIAVFRYCNSSLVVAVQADSVNGFPGVISSGQGVQAPGSTPVQGWRLVRISYDANQVLTSVDDGAPSTTMVGPSGQTLGWGRVGGAFNDWDLPGTRLKKIIVFDRVVSPADHNAVLEAIAGQYPTLTSWSAPE